MSAPGHCRHCGSGCRGRGTPGTSHPNALRRHGDMIGGSWYADHCPACAEAERIAAEFKARAALLIKHGGQREQIRAITYHAAARYARGES